MTHPVPQHILDALTDVEMPKLGAEPAFKDVIKLGAFDVPVHTTDSLVVGSGAAGLRAAVELRRRDIDVTIISQSAWGGTSACSGSDKQTLHTANTADQGDNFVDMAESIRAGGAMDEDTAYIEAVGSPRAMASLQFLGASTAGSTRRHAALSDGSRRGRTCHKLRPPDVAVDGESAGPRGT